MCDTKVKTNADIQCKMDGCSKKGNHELPPRPIGNNNGNSQTLANNILEKCYNGVPQTLHPLSTQFTPTAYQGRKNGGGGRTAQAHHLICCEAMGDDEDWSKICSTFGYNIDYYKNGVILPSSLQIACDLKIPLHKGPHSDTITEIKKRNYVQGVKNKIKAIKAAALGNEYCNTENDIVEELNAKSKEIWVHVKAFTWTITFDGQDYKSLGIGCLNADNIGQKKKALPNIAGNYCGKLGHGFENIGKGSYFKEQN